MHYPSLLCGWGVDGMTDASGEVRLRIPDQPYLYGSLLKGGDYQSFRIDSEGGQRFFMNESYVSEVSPDSFVIAFHTGPRPALFLDLPEAFNG